MKYLTSAQVLVIHDQAIKRFGGSHGIRDLKLLESAVGRPRASFGGKDLYKDIFEKAVALLQSLSKNHAFLDGNKRTTLSSSGIFLKMNGYRLVNTHKEEVEFMIKAENESYSVEKIASWLKKNSKKI